jgi:hypothetical protein
MDSAPAMRFRLGAIVMSLLAVQAPARADVDASRVILLFVVNPPDENAKKGIISWAQAFKINIRFLLADFTAGGAGATPLFKVLINSQNVDDVPGQDILETSFDHQPSLQVVSAVGQYSGQSTIVTNDIYLGNLKGSLPQPYVFISREIQPQQYATTRDALAVVTLYAYAMALAKASTQDNNRYLICRVLDRANMYKGQDLGLNAKPYLDGLFKAISAELELRSCGGKS